MEDLDIDVFFLFVSLFADGEFAKFGPPGMDGVFKEGGKNFFASQVWQKKRGEGGFSEGWKTLQSPMQFREAIFFQCVYIVFCC